jgi:acyl-CoA reductase-like NAD-dependent aldehyde dehydrogenase
MEQPNASSTNAASMVVPLWINGEEVTGTSTYQVISPSSNDVCWEAASASVEDALRAVTAAQNAFATWSITKPAHRAEILHKAARIMEQNLEDYAGYMATEMGAQVQVAQFFVLPLAIQMLKDIAGRTTALCGTIPVCQQEGQSGMVWKVPYGVILGIVPWWVEILIDIVQCKSLPVSS